MSNVFVSISNKRRIYHIANINHCNSRYIFICVTPTRHILLMPVIHTYIRRLFQRYTFIPHFIYAFYLVKCLRGTVLCCVCVTSIRLSWSYASSIDAFTNKQYVCYKAIKQLEFELFHKIVNFSLIFGDLRMNLRRKFKNHVKL